MARMEPVEPITPEKPLHVSIVVFPECDPSIVYGVYDTLWAAGRLWDSLKGRPGGQRPPLFDPRSWR